jgi:hypothetical protein
MKKKCHLFIYLKDSKKMNFRFEVLFRVELHHGYFGSGNPYIAITVKPTAQ